MNDLRPLSIACAGTSPARPDAVRPGVGSGDLVCFSHLRWDYVTQRPQHLMARFARHRRVLFVEEHIPTAHHLPYLEFHAFDGTAVTAVRPRVPDRAGPEEGQRLLAGLYDQMIALLAVRDPVLWFYTPMLWPAAAHLAGDAAAVVYDCMDELAAFDFAPPALRENEAALIAAADLVLTGGQAIFEAKRPLHDNVHAFPSSVDQAHFRRARGPLATPPEQQAIPAPRLGYAGVIDERLDLGLVAAAAAARPDWSFVLVGPVAKIDPARLPQAPNLHWLGQRDYAALPAFMAGWDVALMPFALNAATRFISPTKTPEYLAAGLPVVSTPVRDVVRSYGDLAGVRIADTPESFVAACAAALADTPRAGTPPAGTPPADTSPADTGATWRAEADARLAGLSWDATHAAMAALVDAAATRKAAPPVPPAPALRRPVRPPYDVIVAGAGFAGAVIAERMAEASGRRVLVCDTRRHVGGNAHDAPDAAGLLVHRYGPHIFHTNADEVVAYLSRFTGWRPYEHRVLADPGDGRRLPMPINRTTLAAIFGRDVPDAAAAEALLASLAEPVAKITTARDAVVATVGTRLYETFFEGYTRKQWGLDPSELDASVTARVPARVTDDDRYFLDRFQAMPRDGYTRMFERMLDHPRIDLALGTDFHDLDVTAPLTVYTGPIDRYFGHRFGALPYRSLEFRFETHDRRRFQEVGVVNYPDAAVPWTRITEYKHLTGQVHPQTTISYEFARAEGDPFYPIPRAENRALYRRYDALARSIPGVVFTGRLGSYQYFNMDQVVAQALATHRRLAAAMPAAAHA